MKQITLLFLLCFVLSSSLYSEESYENQFLKLLNQKRLESKRSPLTIDPLLQTLSQEWSLHLAQKQKSFHRSSSFLIDFLKSNHYQFLNENLHQSSQGINPLWVFNRWMNSPVHRKNLLEPKITRMGIAFSESNGDYFVVWNGAN